MTSNYIPKNDLIGNVTIKIIFLGFKENPLFHGYKYINGQSFNPRYM